MSRRQILLLLGFLFVLGLVAYLATQNRQPPFIPEDALHAGPSDARACAICHGPEGDAPRDENHPLGDDCSRCHGRR
jgi:hypothetical protein